MKKVSILICVLMGFAVYMVIIFIQNPECMKQKFGNDPELAFELFRLTYQFFLITVVGGGVALLFKELDQVRGMRQSLRQMYSELLLAYNKAKLVRRQLRAKYGTPPEKNNDHSYDNQDVYLENYDEQMDLLSEAQLTFEVYKKMAKERSLWFRFRQKDLIDSLNKIEGYLNSILNEYEQEYQQFSGNPSVRKMKYFSKLKNFIKPATKNQEFLEKFKESMAIILKELSKGELL